MNENDGERNNGVSCLASHRFRDVHLSSPLEDVVVDGACFVSVCVVVAEAPARFAFGVFAAEVLALHEVLNAPLEMKAELVVEIVGDASARAGESEDAPHGAAARCAVSTSPTTSAYFAQRDSSAASCLRPRALRR